MEVREAERSGAEQSGVERLHARLKEQGRETQSGKRGEI